MTANELLEVIKESNNGDMEETIGMANDLLEDIKKDADKFVKELESEIETFAEDNNCCPTCGKELEIKVNYEISEYQGVECEEEVYSKQCSDCGYIED